MLTGIVPRASAEVYVSTERVAARLAGEGASGTDAAEGDATEQDGVPRSDFDAAVRPLLIVHVGHGRKGYDRAHLPGAVYLEGRDFYATRDGIRSRLPEPDELVRRFAEIGVGPGTDIVLYGDAAGIFPARVYVALGSVGLNEHTYLMDGHLRRWVKEGRATTAEPSVEVAPVALVVPENAGRVLRETPGDLSGAMLLDARSPKRFAGEVRIRGGDAAGHRPGAVNLSWRELVPDTNDPVLSDAAHERVSAVIGDPPAKVIVTDETGNPASVMFVVLRHFGVDAYFDERGLVGYVNDGGELVPAPAAADHAGQ